MKARYQPMDSFGYLSERIDFSFPGGSIKTSSDFAKVRKWVNAQTNKDGYLYPSTEYKVTKDITSNKWKRIPKTSRPAKFFHIPASHDIILSKPGDQKSDRYGLAGFVVQSLAILYGTKLQFWDWFIEGRVPTKTRTINIAIFPDDVEKFFESAALTWQGYTELNKRRMVNLMFVHSVAGSLQWDWQRFLLEYMVTDACYRIANSLRKCSSPRHQSRFEALCDSFGLTKETQWFEIFVRLRNGLFHETLWDGGRIFTARSSISFWAPEHLRRFNHRLITVLLCGRGRYTQSKWFSIGTYGFRLD
jgi:hypothetical protein